MTAPSTSQTNPLDPVFSGVPAVYPQTGVVSPTWNKWFVDLRQKLNVINAETATPVIKVHAGTNVTVDNTDPQNPIVSASGGGGGIVVPDYSTVVLSDSPVGFWKLNETSGTTAVDSSGNGYNGTYMGGYSLGVAMPINLPGGVLLNGTSGYIAIPYGSWMATAAISLESWVWILSGPTSRFGLITRNDSPGAVPYELGVNMTGSGTTFQMGSYNGSGWLTAAALPTQTTLALYHVVGTRDASGNLIIYVNGLPANLPVTATVTSDNGLGMSLGVNHNITAAGAVFLSGVLSSCAVYNKALTPAQVSAHYAAGSIPSWL